MTSLVVCMTMYFWPAEDVLGKGYIHTQRGLAPFGIPVRVDIWKWWRYTSGGRQAQVVAPRPEPDQRDAEAGHGVGRDRRESR